MATPVLSFGTVFELATLGLRQDQRIYNINHWSSLFADEATPTATIDMESLFTMIKNLWDTEILPHNPSDYMVHSYAMRAYRSILWGADVQHSILLKVAELNTVVLTPGGRSIIGDDPLPTYCAMGVRKVTALKDRYGRGSMRLDTLFESDVDQNTIDPMLVAAVQASVDNLLPAIPQTTSLGGFTDFWPVVFSKTKGFVPNTISNNIGASNTQQITAYVVNDRPSSQVSRKQRNVIV